jgi:adenylosuccinate lyase
MNRCDPSAHITDSAFYAGGYSTPEIKRVFCDLYRYQRWLDVEAVLAEAEAELGIIPQDAAADIRNSARISLLDLDFIRHELQVTSHSLMPLLGALSKVCPENSRRYIHFGATTQDIQDTAQSLEIRDVLDIVSRDMRELMELLADLAISYRDLVCIGRSHTQHALPMTMGLKMAVWLDELIRSADRFDEIRPRVIVSQLFGGVGTMDAFGHRGFELLELFSEKLGLAVPDTAWHASRDRVAEFLNVIAISAGTLARMADEVRCLARNETGEMEEPFHPGKIGSSTMPHKRNPELCEQVVVLAKLIKTCALAGLDGLVNEHERDYRSVRLEWVSIADSSMFFCAILSMMKHILGNLVVHQKRVRAAADRAAPYICSEALMFFLGSELGKDRAHRLLYEAAMKAAEAGGSFIDILMEFPEVNGTFSRDAVKQTLHPENHTGMSGAIVDRVLKRARARVEGMKPALSGERMCPISRSHGTCGARL